MKLAVGLAAILLLLPFVSAAAADKGRKETERLEIIRALASETAVSKIALPGGKSGIIIDAAGNFLKQKRTEKEYKENGITVAPGKLVVITEIKFSGGDITFAINGGWKKGGGLLSHIQVGVGNTTQPIARAGQNIYGSYITISGTDKLGLNGIKKTLSSVLDFNQKTPTIEYDPSVSPVIREAIKRGEVIVGMSKEAVLSAKGLPDRKIRNVDETREDWLYGLPPHVLFVTFDLAKGDDGEVIAVKQY